MVWQQTNFDAFHCLCRTARRHLPGYFVTRWWVYCIIQEKKPSVPMWGHNSFKHYFLLKDNAWLLYLPFFRQNLLWNDPTLCQFLTKFVIFITCHLNIAYLEGLQILRLFFFLYYFNCLRIVVAQNITFKMQWNKNIFWIIIQSCPFWHRLTWGCAPF